jgi:hypothetical protein
MVYKKYIKKNGHIYGPYIYHSKRVDGKVVSEYVGPKGLASKNRKLYILFTFVALLFVMLVFLFFTLKPNNFSGNIISNIVDSFKQSPVDTPIVKTEPPTNLNLDSNKLIGDELFQQTARSYKDWIIVTFKLGDYEIEHAYNNGLSKEELNSLIEKDKADWLNQISKINTN